VGIFPPAGSIVNGFSRDRVLFVGRADAAAPPAERQLRPTDFGGAATPPYRDFGLKAARQHSPTDFVVGRTLLRSQRSGSSALPNTEYGQ